MTRLTRLRREIVGEYGSRPLYRMLGYFSLIGLLRVHVLLGDYTLALKVVEHVELGQKVRPVPLSHPPRFLCRCDSSFAALDRSLTLAPRRRC